MREKEGLLLVPACGHKLKLRMGKERVNWSVIWSKQVAANPGGFTTGRVTLVT